MAKDFKPEEHSVDEVKKRLEKADQEEREQILNAELQGKARKTVLEPHGVDPDERRDAAGRVLNPWEVDPADQVTPVVVDETDEQRAAREAQAEQDAQAAVEQPAETPAGSGSAADGEAGPAETV